MTKITVPAWWVRAVRSLRGVWFWGLCAALLNGGLGVVSRAVPRGRESRVVCCRLQALWPPRSLQLPSCGWEALYVIPPLHVGLSLGPEPICMPPGPLLGESEVRSTQW